MFRASGIRRTVTVTVATVAATALAFATAPGVSAATHKNGAIEDGEFALFYNSYIEGCAFDLLIQDTDFSNDYFKRYLVSCNGEGESADDNTASYWNLDTLRWYVYTGKNASGTGGYVPAGVWGNASSTFKNKISSAYYYNAG